MVKISEPISIAVHQLKNPLVILKRYLEVLLSEDIGKVNEKQREYLNDAIENVKIMDRSVKEFLEVSKIEADVYKIEIKPTDLAEISQNIVNELSKWLEALNCSIVFTKPDEFPLVSTDPLRIREVIENLISNSVKYKYQGPGKIEIKLERGDGEAVFSCRDDGVGILEEDFGKVFSKFYRSEDALNSDPDGTGLGLYINKAIIENSGGKIWFEKNKDRGMTFYFSLPFA